MIFLAVMAYLTMCAFLYNRQRSILYYPTPPVESNEAQVIWLANEDQSLKIWYIPGNSDQALIYFGGNAEDVSLNISQLSRLFPQHAIYLHNYRGYGGSTGKTTEAALFSDAVALYEHVRLEHKEIAVMGRSLGTGVAVYLASEKDVKQLVLVTPYDSMARLAGTYYPLIPVSFLMKDKFDSLSLAGKINIPTLVLIAEHDEVIPRRLTNALVSALKPDKTSTTVIKGSGHNTIGSYPQYENALQIFLGQSDI